MVTDNQLLMLVFQHITENPQLRVQMTAVALAESGGDERAHNYNPSTRDDSYGLFQINMFGALGPSRRSSFGLKTNDELFDPATNAKIAGRLWRSGGFTHWRNTYKSERYNQMLPRAVAANQAATLGKGKNEGLLGGAVDALNPFDGGLDLNPVDDVVELLTLPVRWMGAAAVWFGDPHNWVRVLEVAGGLILGIIAVGIAVAPRVQTGAFPALDTARRMRG